MAAPHQPEQNYADTHVADVVLLGASNVTRCIGTLVEMSRAKVGGPVRLHIACGHGRSYGQYARVFGRGLTGIQDCDLWSAIKSARASDKTHKPMYALLTDIGNDIMYGVMPADITQWVRTCVERLLEYDAKIVLTALPMCSLRTVGRWRYGITKACFFPTRSMTYEQAMDRARATNEAITQIGRELEVPIVEHEPQWYGLDPIHIRIGHSRAAWGSILQHWCTGRDATGLSRTAIWHQWLRLHLAVPQQRWILGVKHGRRQPCVRRADGTVIGLY